MGVPTTKVTANEYGTRIIGDSQRHLVGWSRVLKLGQMKKINSIFPSVYTFRYIALHCCFEFTSSVFQILPCLQLKRTARDVTHMQN